MKMTYEGLGFFVTAWRSVSQCERVELTQASQSTGEYHHEATLLQILIQFHAVFDLVTSWHLCNATDPARVWPDCRIIKRSVGWFNSGFC